MTLGSSRGSGGDLTTQIDVAGGGASRRDERAYVMVRIADSAEVRAIASGTSVVIGRGEEADIVLDDSRASRRHAELRLHDGRLTVSDLGSRNGTHVGSIVVRSAERQLARGDEVVVGGARITVVALPSEARAANTTSDPIVVVEPRMREIFSLVDRLASVPSPVLLRGETGAGKEILAELLHTRGARREGPLVRINCAAVPEALIESEMFGHERGAFTGASERKKGFLERAHGGTLFLDEVGDLPLPMQAKLLRALETQRVQRVGGSEEIAVDVRFVCATHRDLERMVEDGSFRRDLFFRIAGFVLEVPPLRERRLEITPLATRFALAFADKLGQPPPVFTPEAKEALEAHVWPGNVRELKNAIEHAVVLSPSSPIEPRHFPKNVQVKTSDASSMQEHVDDAERLAIERALAAASGHRAKAAELLGVSKRTLQYRLAKLGIKG